MAGLGLEGEIKAPRVIKRACPIPRCCRERAEWNNDEVCEYHAELDEHPPVKCSNCHCIRVGSIGSRGGDTYICDRCEKHRRNNDGDFPCPSRSCKSKRSARPNGLCNKHRDTSDQCEDCYEYLSGSAEARACLDGRVVCRGCMNKMWALNEFSRRGSNPPDEFITVYDERREEEKKRLNGQRNKRNRSGEAEYDSDESGDEKSADESSDEKEVSDSDDSNSGSDDAAGEHVEDVAEDDTDDDVQNAAGDELDEKHADLPAVSSSAGKRKHVVIQISDEDSDAPPAKRTRAMRSQRIDLGDESD